MFEELSARYGWTMDEIAGLPIDAIALYWRRARKERHGTAAAFLAACERDAARRRATARALAAGDGAAGGW